MKLLLIFIFACSSCFYFMGERKCIIVIHKKELRKISKVIKIKPKRFRHENGQYVRYYFGQFRNAYDGRSKKCKK